MPRPPEANPHPGKSYQERRCCRETEPKVSAGCLNPGQVLNRPLDPEANPVQEPGAGRKFRSRAPVTELAEHQFEPLDFGVRIARSVPKVIVVHGVCLVPCLYLESWLRSSCMPRCKLTRTEPGVSPVRAAISVPVMPSTRRKIRVSR